MLLGKLRALPQESYHLTCQCPQETAMTKEQSKELCLPHPHLQPLAWVLPAVSGQLSDSKSLESGVQRLSRLST